MKCIKQSNFMAQKRNNNLNFYFDIRCSSSNNGPQIFVTAISSNVRTIFVTLMQLYFSD